MTGAPAHKAIDCKRITPLFLIVVLFGTRNNDKIPRERRPHCSNKAAVAVFIRNLIVLF